MLATDKFFIPQLSLRNVIVVCKTVSKCALSVPMCTLFFLSCFVASVSISAAEPDSAKLSSEEQSSANTEQRTPEQLLMQMEESTRQLNYQGTLVYSQGHRMETLKIFHKLENGQRWERLVHLTGTPREIIRRGEKVICVHPKTGVVKLDNSIPAGPFARNYQAQLRSVNEPYTVKLSGNTRVAGRDVIVLAVQPKDAFRYGFKLALDSETGLLLQSLMVDEKNKVLERFEYTEIEIGGEITIEQLSPKFDVARDQLSVVDVSKGVSVSVSEVVNSKAKQELSTGQREAKLWNVGWLPAGFLMSSSRNDEDSSSSAEGTTRKGAMRNSLMYSDGLTAFSVFIAPNVDMRQLAVQSGATVAYTSVKRDDKGVFSVTVVGEIPRKAAKNIATSVSRVKGR